jgi:hypothetical protein
MRIFTAAAAALLLGSLAPALADTPVQHVRGTISSVSGDKVTIATSTGPVVVTLGPATKYGGVAPAALSDIKAGTFIGTANVPGDGPARALEVVVFPASLAGSGEGDYPWDLGSSAGDASSMTNGTVAAPQTSSMTNATVSHVEAGANKVVTLTYKGGTKVVAISPSTPIVRIVPATRALIVAGAHVVVFPPLSPASRIVVGEQGAVPPM